MRALHVRLTIAIGLLFALLGFALLVVIDRSSDRYADEVRQRLDAGIALYVVRELPLLDGGRVNDQSLKELASRAMTLNPSAEVYLLDPAGHVVSTIVQHGRPARRTVRLGPIHEFLAAPDRRPLYGDDPTSLIRQRVFSVAPISDQGRISGYLYVVLGGQPEQSIAALLWSSYALRAAVIALLLVILTALGTAAALFFGLTRRLRALERRMHRWLEGLPSSAIQLVPDRADDDEIGALARCFAAMSQAIEAHIEDLKRTDGLRRELIANVSHDLRTPLTALRGYIETVLVKSEAVASAELSEYLRIALRQADQLGRLVDALFELARLESGAVVPTLEPVCIGEFLQDISVRFRLLAEAAGVALRTRLDTSGALVRADVALVERAVGNLLENAIRYTPRGGEVRLEMSLESSCARVKIVDTGIGIGPEHLPHVFDRLYRVRDRSDRSRAGLGLSIVKRIIELHSQHIHLTSSKGEGTTVEFTLEHMAPVSTDLERSRAGPASQRRHGPPVPAHLASRTPTTQQYSSLHSREHP